MSSNSRQNSDQKRIARNRVVVIKFGAKWCGACKDSEPRYDKLETKYKDKPVDFYVVDVDKPPRGLPGYAQKVLDGIKSIPVIVVYEPNDKPPKKFVGWDDREITEAIENGIRVCKRN